MLIYGEFYGEPAQLFYAEFSELAVRLAQILEK
jgi:hypothetical protein